MLAGENLLQCALSKPMVVALQEVICDAGTHVESSKTWTLVMGRTDREWRGEGIAYTTQHYHHTHTQNHEGALTVILSGGNAPTTPAETAAGQNTPTNVHVGIVSAHLPHHATLEQAQQLLASWGDSGAMQLWSVLMGADLNENLEETDIGIVAHTSRGEAILHWLAEHGLDLPEQALNTPTYHPYNRAMRSRRLDYCATRGLLATRGRVHSGSRDIIQSDHDALSVQIEDPPVPKKQSATSWGPRILRDADHVFQELAKTRKGGPRAIIAEVAKEITMPAPQGGEPWNESEELKTLRRRAKQAVPEERRTLWKQVWHMLKKERRAWMKRKVEAAALMNWGELRDLDKQRQQRHWEHQLLSSPDWRHHLAQHFEGTFATVPAEIVREGFQRLRDRLRGLCKRTRWNPFCLEELNEATFKWGRRKATGADEVSLEALQALLQDEVWSHRLLYLFNDVLYTGKLHGNMGEGITILLPKEATPEEWGQTRPITLSSATLKWFSQLLLGRSSHLLNPLVSNQWAWKGKQAEELILVLRKITRVGADWRLPTWIAKLDVKKAFDSVYQQNLGALVGHWIGERGGQPWEAHAWLALLEADEVNIHVGGHCVSIKQTTGVRQGGPDSPVLFAAQMGRAIQRAQLPPPEGAGVMPPCPTDAGAFMDDTYI